MCVAGELYLRVAMKGFENNDGFVGLRKKLEQVHQLTQDIAPLITALSHNMGVSKGKLDDIHSQIEKNKPQ